MSEVLVTARLTLSPHGLGDLDDSLALWSDPAVVRFIGGRAFSAEEVWFRLLRYAGHWQLLGFGYWSLRETATGRHVGEAGFAQNRREIEPSLLDCPEAGWALRPWAQRRGLAAEAMRAILAWNDAHLNAARTVCLIDPENAASLRLAERLGYREFARTEYKGRETVLLERWAK